jgi:epoxyqueuosine reductase
VNLKELIVDTAHDIGIDMVYFTDCKSNVNLEEYLNYRKENNLNTSFEEEDIKKRIDPKETLPSCKSIIVLGISYNSDYKIKNYPLKGSLSKSSWGQDYHRVLNDKIKILIDNLKMKIDFEYKSFVDTGPLVDRELAKKSSLGYYGKNCSIINKEYGSFIFIGYILTDLDIDIEKPKIEDDCGDCDRCIRACPTGALEGAYTLNPKKCISYLTQTKEVIPEDLREKMGIKIYGCDTCQLVCPKNKGIKTPNHKEFIPTKTGWSIDIKELLNISNREFKNKYAHMAGSWRGKNTLKRNAIIAIGNMKDEKNIPILLEEKEKDNPKLKEYIRWSIENHSK